MLQPAMIRRAIAMNNHPAGRAGMRTLGPGYANTAFGGWGITDGLVIKREFNYGGGGEWIVTRMPHDHRNGTHNCYSCLS